MNFTVSSLGELWDFWTVKLATLASALGSIGVAWPALPADLTGGFPTWFGWFCQVCALLVTLGIVPARAVKQQPKPGLKP